jgi:hypothetical protein
MKKYLVTAFVLILMGCELIVDVKVPFDHAQLTVNSFANPDSLWKAQVSLNQFILSDTTYTKIENAAIAVYEDGLEVATLVHQGNGMYKSITGKPEEGKSYELRVAADGYASVSALTSIPFSVPIVSVEMTKNGGQNGSSLEEMTIRLKFNDPPGVKNYYLVTLETENEYMNSDGNIIKDRRPTHIESNDPALISDNPSSDAGVYVRDVFFDGQGVNLSLTADESSALVAGSAFLTLRSLSEDYYKYNTTVMLQNNTVSNPFAQPVNVYNNIDHGFGVFAGFSQSVFIRTNPTPVITEITPMSGMPGDTIHIRGENLAGDVSYYTSVYFTTVYDFNGKQFRSLISALSTRVSANELKVVVPSQAVSGKIGVTVRGKTAVSREEFEVIQ